MPGWWRGSKSGRLRLRSCAEIGGELGTHEQGKSAEIIREKKTTLRPVLPSPRLVRGRVGSQKCWLTASLPTGAIQREWFLPGDEYRVLRLSLIVP